MRELAERRVAQLNGRIQGLESRLHQLGAENASLAARAPSGTSPQVPCTSSFNPAKHKIGQNLCFPALLSWPW